MTLPAHDRRRLRRGFAVLRRMVALEPLVFGIAIFGAAVYAMATVGSSFVLGRVTDRVIIPRFETGHVAAGTVIGAVVAIVVVGLVKCAGIITRRIAATYAGARVAATLRRRVVERYQEVPFEYHQRTPTGELLAHAGADVDAATEVLNPLPFSTGVLVIVVVAAVWLVLTDPRLALIGFTLFPSLIVLNVIYQRVVSGPAEHVQEEIGHVSAVAHESFEGVLIVKALGAEALESERFRVAAERLRDAKIRVATLRASFEAVLDALPGLAIVALLAVGAWRVDSGAITTGDVVSFVSLFTLMVWPLRLIGYVLGDLPRAVVGWDRVQQVLAEPIDPRHDAPAARPSPSRALEGDGRRRGVALDVEGLSFGYEDGADVLHEVTFTVRPGCTVAVVGPTGSGKSTLLLLVAGLLPPRRGAVRLDGRDAQGYGIDELRHTVAMAFQEPFLFGESVAENILLGADEAELEPAADLAAATRFVDHLSARFDTVVGERGATLSGGQRQRIALARALARRPRLLLLDDATSSVDPTTEARILASLTRRLEATTRLVVANRPSTIALADEVVYLEEGRVLARGPHLELLATVPGYERLVRAYEHDREERHAS